MTLRSNLCPITNQIQFWIFDTSSKLVATVTEKQAKGLKLLDTDQITTYLKSVLEAQNVSTFHPVLEVSRRYGCSLRPPAPRIRALDSDQEA